MSYPPEWPVPGKMHFRLINERLGTLDLDCDSGYVVSAYDLGFPDIREVKLNNSLDDGVFDVTRFFGARAVSLDVTLKPYAGLTPASPYVASEAYLRDRLVGYLYPGIRSRLLFSEHGDQRVRQMLIRGTKASLAVNRKEYNQINVSWLAPRGTMASYDERCYLYRFGETSGEFMDLTIVNEGTVPVDWRASISGWSIHPLFTLNGTETLAIEYDADPGDVITLDSFSRTITINGVPSSYAYIGDDAVWFKIPPGFNTLRVSHAGGVAAFGYPYARWQEPASTAYDDYFERPGPGLGADWETPAVIPADTVAVPLVIDAGEVIVSVPDGGAVPHEWGFARNVTEPVGGVGTAVEMDVTNLAQTSIYGPIIRSKAELYTNMNDTNAACQALSVDFDYGITATPTPPVIFEDPFETIDGWTIVGSNASLTVAGRNGQAVQLGGISTYLTHNLDVDDEATIVVAGLAFRITGSVGATTISSVRNLLEFRGAGGNVLHGKVAVETGGSLFVTDAAGVNRGGSPLGTVLPNTWHYAEVRYVLSDTVGEFTLRLDGEDVAGAFDLDTVGIGATTIDQIRIPVPNPTSGGTHTYDDFYLATGDLAAFIGPLDVANGSLAYELHQYTPTGATANTVASGAIPYNYEAGAARLRLESNVSGLQRFLLDGVPIVEAEEEDPVVGPLVGFGASYETFEYDIDPGEFVDDFERGSLGADWVVAAPRSQGKTTVLPTIQGGAAVTAAHTGKYPGYFYYNTTTGATLAGGVAQTMTPHSEGFLTIARVLQTDPAGIPLTASPGWTQIGTAAVGTHGGDFMEAFDNFGAWTTAGTAAIVAGRTGNAARLTGVGTSNYAARTLRTESATVAVGFAHQINSLAAATSEIVQFYSDGNVTQHNRVTVNTNGSLTFWRGTTALGTTIAGLIAINTWNYIEVRATLSDTAGAVTIRVNGAVVLDLSAIDTQNAGTKTVYDTIRLTGPITTFYNTFDDLYVVTGAGATFKGDQVIPVSSGVELLRMSVFARACDGTSQDNLTLTGAPTAFVTAMESFWTSNTAGGNDGFTPAVIPNIRIASATGAVGFPDPPSLPLGPARDWLFLASAGVDIQSSPSMGGSTGYSNTHGTTVSPGNLCAMRSGYRTATLGGAENPAAYTGTTGRPWIAYTIAIPSAGGVQWGGAEHVAHEFDATAPLNVEALVNSTATSGASVELYSHMTVGSAACRVLQIDLSARTWRMGHYAATGDDMVAVASGALPAGAYPATFRLEGDPDGTQRFLFNGTLVQSAANPAAPNPTTGARVGFGEHWVSTSSPSPQVQLLAGEGIRFLVGPPPPEPTSPRIERFTAKPLSGTDWAIPDLVIPITDPTVPRSGAPRIEEDYWSKVGDDPSPPSPNGAPLADYNGSGAGMFIYTDGWTYDGLGWRDNVGRHAYPDGAVVRAVSNTPPNNPPPGGKPPWAWTPPVDPITGEPSILTVHFCYFDQWL